jgi:hypothetical protein
MGRETLERFTVARHHACLRPRQLQCGEVRESDDHRNGFVGAGPSACPPLCPPYRRPSRSGTFQWAAASVLLALTLSGCGVFNGAASATPTVSPLPTIAPPPTPIVADQVDRAKRLGPGFLDYCPRHEGAAQAQYDVMLPGQGPIGGYCQTHINRQPGGDIITFYAHWDARPIHHGQGTVSFTYGVKRDATPPATPVAEMLDQTGPLPP